MAVPAVKSLAHLNAQDSLRVMALSSIFLAEEALSLPPEQRAELAKLLTESLREDRRTDDEIRAELQRRFADLKSGRDNGLSFEQTFGSKA